MGKGVMCGPTDLPMMAGLCRASAMEKGAGSHPERAETYILEAIKMTRNADMEDMFGRTDAYTKATLKLI